MDPLILLVNSPYTKNVYKMKRVPGLVPPLGLAYLAASLEQAGLGVEILDANALLLSIEETAERIIQSPIKYIGFNVVTATIPLVYKLSSLVKAKKSDKFIIVGGPHVTFLSEETLKECPAIDAAVRGEGEATICELIKTLMEKGELSKIKGVTFRSGDKIAVNPDREFVENIDTLPFPARHLLPIHLYSPSPINSIGFSGRQYATMMTSRGCPNKCTFCSSAAFWRRVRLRSLDGMADEIEFLIKQYGVRHVNFLDDTLIISEARMEQFCHLMIKRNINIKWSCYARVSTVTPKLVELMKRTGCQFIQFGVESGNQEILNRVEKNITIEQVRKAVGAAKKVGLKVMCDFMIGLPGDTVQTVNQTINFAKELSPNFAFFSITTPFPGSALYEEYRKEGRLKEGYIWDNMSLHEGTNFSTPTMTSKEMEELYVKAHRRFYYRPAFIWQTFLWVLRHPYEFRNFYLLAKIQITKELKNIFHV